MEFSLSLSLIKKHPNGLNLLLRDSGPYLSSRRADVVPNTIKKGRQISLPAFSAFGSGGRIVSVDDLLRAVTRSYLRIGASVEPAPFGIIHPPLAAQTLRYLDSNCYPGRNRVLIGKPPLDRKAHVFSDPDIHADEGTEFIPASISNFPSDPLPRCGKGGPV